MNRRTPTEISQLCVKELRNRRLLRALFALIRAISSLRTLTPELIKGSQMYSIRYVPSQGVAQNPPIRRKERTQLLDCCKYRLCGIGEIG